MTMLRWAGTGLATAALIAFAGPLAAQDGGRPLAANLTGQAEVGGGDPDGTGSATLRLNQGQAQICYDLMVSEIGAATAAHIHQGTSDENGPPVVTLEAPDAEGSASGCVDVEAGLVMEIRQNPRNYYVNVHNEEFPGGAVRGQLDWPSGR